MIFSYLILYFLTASSAWCENSNEKPKEFYSNDYASSTFQHGSSKLKDKHTKKALDKKKTTQLGEDQAAPSLPDASFTELKSEEKEQVPLLPIENDLTPIDFEKRLKVRSIGVILNSDDKEHALEKLRELSELATEHDWTIGAIYALGDLANIALTKEMRMLQVRGAMLTQRDSLPKRYEAIKLSPTWLVNTDEGEVILEATGKLKRNFNSSGEYLLPKLE